MHRIGVFVMKPFALRMLGNAAAGVLLTVAAAGAADLELSGGQLSYTSTAEVVADTVTVSLSGGVYTVDDPPASIQIGPNALAAGCAAFDSNTAVCPASALSSLVVATGPGDDTITLTNVAVPALLIGGQGADTVHGGSEDDTFLWNPGDSSDVLDGGGGQDTLQFTGANISEHIVITPDGAGFDLTRDVGNVLLEVQNVELLRVTTQGGNDDVSTSTLINTRQELRASGDLDTDTLPDTLHVDGAGLCVTRENDTFVSAGRQPIQFASFDDILVGNADCRPDPCATAVATQGCTVNGVRNQPCQGTPGNDVIIGTPGADVILGGGGNDRIRGGSGDDLLCGEDGDDLLMGGSGNDTLVGGPGNDRLRGNTGNDVLLGGDGDDQLFGDGGTDNLDGGPGDDRLKGGRDADALQGGPGADLLDGGSQDDRCGDADQLGPFPRCELP